MRSPRRSARRASWTSCWRPCRGRGRGCRSEDARQRFPQRSVSLAGEPRFTRGEPTHDARRGARTQLITTRSDVPASRFLAPEVLARIGTLELLARTVVEGFVSGLHRSPYLGR